MNYQVVVGQDETKKRLSKMVLNKRVPHAILFRGPAGSGTLPLALAFASHLLCTNKTNEGACGTCSACLKTNKLIHPDLHLVFPIVLSKESRTSQYWLESFRQRATQNPYFDLDDWMEEIDAGNKVPIIGTDEANDIIKRLSYTSFEGGYRILILWLPEKLNPDASNKILKILEEPGEATVFLFVSQQPDQLMPTILSRLQQIALTKLSNEEIRDYLMEGYKLVEDKAKQFAYLADGDLHEALRLSFIEINKENIEEDEETEVDLVEHFQNFMRYAFNYDFPKIQLWVETNASLGREFHKRFFQYGLSMFRDCLMFNYGSKELVKLNEAELQFLKKFAPFVNSGNYEKLIEEFNAGYYHIDRNANPKILFTDLFGSCNQLIAGIKKG